MSLIENTDDVRQRRAHISKMHVDLIARRAEIEDLVREAYEYAGNEAKAKTHSALAGKALDEFTTHIEAALNMLKIVQSTLQQARISAQESDERRAKAARKLNI